MAGMNTLQMIKMIPTFDGRTNYVKWTRSFNDMLQITWLRSKLVSELERPEPIPRENRGGKENASDIDDIDSNPSEVSADGSRNSDENLAIVKTLRPGTQQMTMYSVSCG